ncbi:putative ankyrin repeat-containing domain, PGG domain-containing protein [Rosa chinensis]|uniref:Putative ankyrin repeat-containing domain, PGG domain-containing protein n=1 Tax=Rosa chinensis TaxID=74649 RepID=A0A2P6S7P3_ROSCH|nr:putative ankyrin repeat-containing domain, PGG domain-containing protein [Rosa chinensis]
MIEPFVHVTFAYTEEGKDSTLCLRMYRAALKGDWEEAEETINKDESIVRCGISLGSYTALHVAVGARQVQFVEKLVEKMQPKDLRLQDETSNTAFCLAAAAGSLEIAKIMIRKDPDLPGLLGSKGRTPLYFAALFGHQKMAACLYSLASKEENLQELFFTCIKSGLYGLASLMLKKNPQFAWQRDKEGQTALHLLAIKPSAFTSKTPQGICMKVKYLTSKICIRLTQCECRSLHLYITFIKYQFTLAFAGLTSRILKICAELASELDKNDHQLTTVLDLLAHEKSSVPTKKKEKNPSILPTKKGKNASVPVTDSWGIRKGLSSPCSRLRKKLERSFALKVLETYPELLLELDGDNLRVALSNLLNQEHATSASGLLREILERSELLFLLAQTLLALLTIIDACDRALTNFMQLCSNFAFIVEGGLTFIPHVNITTDENSAQALVKDLWDEVMKQDYPKFKDILTRPTHLLFDAAESGNSKFVAQLIHDSPDLIWETTDDDRNWTIIHAAVKNRNERIFSLIYKIGLIKDVIATFRDKENGNTILHLVAKLAPTSQLNKLPGAAFQMQRELLWFEEVKKIMRPSHIEMKNNNSADGITPQDLFSEQHDELLKAGQEWMNGTARSCTLLSTLIASALFAAIVTVSVAGNHPLQKTSFRIFIISDAIACLLALISTLTFMAILTSPYAERDFLIDLPGKLKTGLAFLLVSIITMMVAFSSSIFIGYGRKDFLSSLVTVLALLTGVVSIVQQWQLLSIAFGSASSSESLFTESETVLQSNKKLTVPQMKKKEPSRVRQSKRKTNRSSTRN